MVKVGVGLIFLAIFDFVAWRRLRRRAPQLRGRVLVRQAWLVAGLGLILHWVALDAPLLLHECCNGLAEILLAAALALFSWFLARISGLIDDDTAANPLRRLWLLYALGVALQIVDIPDPALTGCWMALLLVFFRIFRQRVGCDPGPLRLAGRGTPVLTVGLVLLSAVGWQHLSVLVLAGWFLLLAAVQIGVGLSRLVAEWQTRADREGTSLLTRSVVSGLGFPVIFLSLFFLVLYWFSIELGGQDLFVEAVAFTVTIGNVSVTLGRLALILTGFFLTRSAIDVARSFLRNLPRLRPEIDPGVCDVLDTTSMGQFLPTSDQFPLEDQIKNLGDDELLDFWEETQYLDRLFEEEKTPEAEHSVEYERVILQELMHAGDGNCHVNIPVNSNDQEMMRQAWEATVKVFETVTTLGGAVSGEHGIGITKIAFLEQSKIDALRAYKKRVDPKNIINPGKLTTRVLEVEPYTFSFNRLIRDLKKTALPDKDTLINILAGIQFCNRCGKCKQVCPMDPTIKRRSLATGWWRARIFRLSSSIRHS